MYSCQPSASLTHAVPPSHARPSYAQGTSSAPVLSSRPNFPFRLTTA
ncbi:hypothetical protein NIA69_13690 [Gemmiger formicilis]|nr:hypothetical protein [Gemmiger formicilis]